ncbi:MULTISPECIES: hypothetical protein [Streptomyces]|uniref:hypothetical protein n=1 Tax=Streptomyces TaxID=1883 RepID=UPI0029BC73C0|nr:hypothetical protein [Streptomyces sp. ND04-05B]MDX3065081.1 hypothetical protein [Streptomyces sp. ND04-05B]
MNLHDAARRLPDIAVLRDHCRGLAVLHAILEPEAARRFCAFAVTEDGPQSAWLRHRDGRWLRVDFCEAGALLHWHKEPGQGRIAVPDDVLKTLRPILHEVRCDCLADPQLMAAALWREKDSDAWRATDDSAPGASPSLLRCLTDRSPERARRFATKRYGTPCDLEAVRHLIGLRPLTDALVAGLNPALDLTDLGPDLASAQYPLTMRLPLVRHLSTVGPGAAAEPSRPRLASPLQPVTTSLVPSLQPHGTALLALDRPRHDLELFRRRDASGLITTAVFRYGADHDQQHFTDLGAEVDSDMVAIGGGASAVDSPHGALLTASYPADDGSAWLASSKDHNVPQPHRLTAFAIGMKIDGVSRQRLVEELLTVVQTRSRRAAHPYVSARVPQGHTLIGGGFRVNWQDPPSGEANGNLATASFPRAGGAWTVRSKDHQISSPCTIDAFAVCLKSSFVIDGAEYTVRAWTDFTESEGSPVPHPSAALPLSPSGYVLTGMGAEALPTEPGSLLWQLEPTTDGTTPGVRAGAKHHGQWSAATLCAWALGIRLQRS